jgi:NAD(P)-dependent dehydrogenase (short-subunit alcohol dehydrogenase family)
MSDDHGAGSDEVIGEGRVAVVTGGASGIGRALCRGLGAQGSSVVVADLDEAGAAAVADEITAAGGTAMASAVDVADAGSVSTLAQEVVDRLGHVELVVNNAGVSTFNLLQDQTLEDWRWVIDVDLWGVVHGVQAFLPVLRAQGTPAHVVNTSSMGGVMGGVPFIGPYVAAKQAVVGLSETLAVELAMQGSPVGVSVLCPGSTDTAIMESERVRPADRGNEARTTDAESMRVAIKETFTGPTGLPPEVVAERTIRAVREKRFWIFPHPGERAIVEARVEAMLGAFTDWD